MATDEDRRADARTEILIDRALANGTAGHCYWCGDPTTHKELDDVGEPILWLCYSCYQAEHVEVNWK